MLFLYFLGAQVKLSLSELLFLNLLWSKCVEIFDSVFQGNNHRLNFIVELVKKIRVFRIGLRQLRFIIICLPCFLWWFNFIISHRLTFLNHGLVNMMSLVREDCFDVVGEEEHSVICMIMKLKSFISFLIGFSHEGLQVRLLKVKTLCNQI